MNASVNLSLALVAAMLFSNGCAAHLKRAGVEGVEVAVYNEAVAAVAGPLTVKFLHRHGLAAGGYGGGGWIHVVVSRGRAEDARQVLRKEWSSLSEANRSSFQIVDQSDTGSAKGLDFLKDVPSLAEVSLNMTEAEFLELMHRQGLDGQWEISGGRRTYWVKPKRHVLVVFGFQEGRCSGIQRLPD